MDCFINGKLLKKNRRNLKSNDEFNIFWRNYLD
jgi:hypothetical protein